MILFDVQSKCTFCLPEGIYLDTQLCFIVEMGIKFVMDSFL